MRIILDFVGNGVIFTQEVPSEGKEPDRRYISVFTQKTALLGAISRILDEKVEKKA